MPGNPRAQARPEPVAVVECEHVVRPARPRQHPVRAGLPLDCPPDAIECTQDPACLGGRPASHATTNRSLGLKGTGSPCSSLSAMTRSASAAALTRASLSLAP